MLLKTEDENSFKWRGVFASRQNKYLKFVGTAQTVGKLKTAPSENVLTGLNQSL